MTKRLLCGCKQNVPMGVPIIRTEQVSLQWVILADINSGIVYITT